MQALRERAHNPKPNRRRSMSSTTNDDDVYSVWFDRILADADPDQYYRQHFHKGFFRNERRIAVGYIPSSRINSLLMILDACSDASDERFPMSIIKELFGWEYTLQSVAQEHTRNNGKYTLIEDTFLNGKVFSQSSECISDLFDIHPSLQKTDSDASVCDTTVRLMHLLWLLRGFAHQCDLVVTEYCVRQQIQTAKERNDVFKHFNSW
jgi:hypothetical protein